MRYQANLRGYRRVSAPYGFGGAHSLKSTFGDIDITDPDLRKLLSEVALMVEEESDLYTDEWNYFPHTPFPRGWRIL